MKFCKAVAQQHRRQYRGPGAATRNSSRRNRRGSATSKRPQVRQDEIIDLAVETAASAGPAPRAEIPVAQTASPRSAAPNPGAPRRDRSPPVASAGCVERGQTSLTSPAHHIQLPCSCPAWGPVTAGAGQMAASTAARFPACKAPDPLTWPPESGPPGRTRQRGPTAREPTESPPIAERPTRKKADRGAMAAP